MTRASGEGRLRRARPAPGSLLPAPADRPLVLARTGPRRAADPAAGLAGPGGLSVVLGSPRPVGESRTALGLPPA
ncbi:hypothetical protein ACFWGM_13660 [Streptomyces roseolus]|uniref:hypothetical protein n=1 Tax=Streptomyces roseolus TaxID=67358 RepID=UPI00363346DA